MTVYKASELPTEKARERARDWYRNLISAEDFECTVDGLREFAGLLGFGDSNHPRQRGKGPSLWWAVGYCQSDRATFEGTWYASDFQPKVILDFGDEDHAALAARFAEFAARFPSSHASKTERYTIDHCDIFGNDDEELPDGWEAIASEATDELRAMFRDLDQFAYRSLRDESDYLLSDESIDETLEVNEYEFNEDGDRI
jgi:hypothetical protein